MRLWCRNHPNYLGLRKQRVVKCLTCKVLFFLNRKISWIKVGKEAPHAAVEADPQ